MATYQARNETVQHGWYLVDAANQTLGRLASQIAMRLRGKHKPIYTPHVDTGDFIVVINIDKIHTTGNKMEDKLYYRHSNRPGSLKIEALKDKLARKPEEVLELAVKGMLPKGPLGRQMFKKLKVYAGEKHPHAAQNPQPLVLNEAQDGSH